MTKFNKGITLAIAPYKTITLMTTECDSFEECNKKLLEELNRMPEIKKLNASEIEKVFGNGKRK